MDNYLASQRWEVIAEPANIVEYCWNTVKVSYLKIDYKTKLPAISMEISSIYLLVSKAMSEKIPNSNFITVLRLQIWKKTSENVKTVLKLIVMTLIGLNIQL